MVLAERTSQSKSQVPFAVSLILLAIHIKFSKWSPGLSNETASHLIFCVADEPWHSGD